LGLLLLPTAFLVVRLPCRFGLSAINDTAAVLSTWLPLEFGWVPEHIIAALTSDDTLPLVEVICLIHAIVLFTVVRPTGLNASFSFRAFTFADTYERAYAACGVFFVLGMPLCLVTGFITWQPSSATFLEFAGLYVLIYFGTAIIEEILFRAVIQSIIEDHIELHWPRLALDTQQLTINSDDNSFDDALDQHDGIPSTTNTSPHHVLEPWRQRSTIVDEGTQGVQSFRRLGSWISISRSATIALIFASVIFGLAHLDNDTPNYHQPNFLYALFATFAGILYGWVYRTTGFLTAGAITHATVDWMWVIFFH
ncbi:MAG: CPBP family intramembrane metalloprotease, partial [Mycobacteriaceae bacterium]|nr:CPBP family intramembrane metalloprotease [Mycobacteriaceae bacterium]